MRKGVVTSLCSTSIEKSIWMVPPPQPAPASQGMTAADSLSVEAAEMSWYQTALAGKYGPWPAAG